MLTLVLLLQAGVTAEAERRRSNVTMTLFMLRMYFLQLLL